MSDEGVAEPADAGMEQGCSVLRPSNEAPVKTMDDAVLF